MIHFNICNVLQAQCELWLQALLPASSYLVSVQTVAFWGQKRLKSPRVQTVFTTITHTGKQSEYLVGGILHFGIWWCSEELKIKNWNVTLTHWYDTWYLAQISPIALIRLESACLSVSWLDMIWKGTYLSVNNQDSSWSPWGLGSQRGPGPGPLWLSSRDPVIFMSWFPPDTMLPIECRRFNFSFIRPENPVSHNLRVHQMLYFANFHRGKLQSDHCPPQITSFKPM